MGCAQARSSNVVETVPVPDYDYLRQETTSFTQDQDLQSSNKKTGKKVRFHFPIRIVQRPQKSSAMIDVTSHGFQQIEPSNYSSSKAISDDSTTTANVTVERSDDVSKLADDFMDQDRFKVAKENYELVLKEIDISNEQDCNDAFDVVNKLADVIIELDTENARFCLS
jgi:hypothetical protein